MAAVIVNGFRFVGADFVYQPVERAAYAQLAADLHAAAMALCHVVREG